MNNLDKFVKKINEKKICFGAGVWFREPLISEIFCELGFDFLWICSEHTALDKRDILAHIMSTRGSDTAAFVRVPGIMPEMVKPILEMDPAGIIFPFIKTEADAINAIKACRYPPDGIRGFGPIRSNDFYNMDLDKYYERSKSNPWVMLQIEHIDAVNNLDKILEISGINSFVIGPNDLANSMGLFGQSKSDEVLKVIELVLKKIKAKGIVAGVAIGYNLKEAESYKRLVDYGADWFSMTGDFMALRYFPKMMLDGARAVFETNPK